MKLEHKHLTPYLPYKLNIYFDVFGLIKEWLAIDINTLENGDI